MRMDKAVRTVAQSRSAWNVNEQAKRVCREEKNIEAGLSPAAQKATEFSTVAHALGSNAKESRAAG